MDLNQKLLAAFRVEYLEHLEGIRACLARWEQQGDATDVDEAFRRAHSLKGAARVTGFGPVETLSHRLESVFSQVRAQTLPAGKELLRVVHGALDSIEDVTAALLENSSPPDFSAPLGELDALASGTPKPPATGLAVRAADGPVATPVAPVKSVDTVRLSTESLDRLQQSTGQLLTAGLQQDSLSRELQGINRQLNAVLRECESLKRTKAGPLRRMSENPEFEGIGRYLDLVEHELGALSRRMRGSRLLQQRSAWSVKLLGEQLQEDVRLMRMVPAESEFQGFRKMMRDLAREEGKEIEFRVSGFEVLADRMVLQALKDPLMHVLRNAISHGIESAEERRRAKKNPTGQVTLQIQASGGRLAITVEDDGRGIDVGQISEVAVRRGLLSETELIGRSSAELAQLLFQPGFSTSRVVTELAGRGMGLSTAYETVTRLQGEIVLGDRPGGGAALQLTVPLSISTHRLLLVSCGGQTLAIPCYGVVGLHRVKVQAIESVEGQPMIVIGGTLMPVCSLAHLLDERQADTPLEADTLLLAVLRSGPKRIAVVVDHLLAERSALIKNLGPPADALVVYVGGILLEDGSVALVLNPAELVEHFKPSRKTTRFKPGKPKEDWRPPTILVVDDSFTTRTLETSILETNGYQVRVAVDGVEALEQLRAESIDLVITDVQMPRLDGFGLLEEIKRDALLARIPVIVVTSVEKREDQQRGLSLGADAYIVKRKFDHQDLLKTIRQIL